MRFQAEILVSGGSVGGTVHLLAGRLHDLTELSTRDRSHVVVTTGVDPLPAIPPPPPWRALIVEEQPRDPSAYRQLPGPVLCLDADLFREGEPALIDGATGVVEIPGVEEIRVVTSFLEAADRTILLLRRSARVGTFQGRWAGVSGFLEEPSAEAQARREIREETGIERGDLELRATGRVVYARDANRAFAVHPFRFRSRTKDLRLDWEHSNAEWVAPTEIYRRQTVPKLHRVWEAVAPGRAEEVSADDPAHLEAKR